MVLIFQPAEEGGGGSKRMIDEGVVQNIDAIFGFHITSEIPFGTVASRPGPIMAGSGFFEAVITGKGGHAAIPQHTIDPIIAASNVVVSLQHLVSREADPLDSQVNYVCIHLLTALSLQKPYPIDHPTRICSFNIVGKIKKIK